MWVVVGAAHSTMLLLLLAAVVVGLCGNKHIICLLQHLNNTKVGILIIGAGPTGLGAATRLHQHGYDDWLMVEQVRAAWWWFLRCACAVRRL